MLRERAYQRKEKEKNDLEKLKFSFLQSLI